MTVLKSSTLFILTVLTLFLRVPFHFGLVKSLFSFQKYQIMSSWLNICILLLSFAMPFLIFCSNGVVFLNILDLFLSLYLIMSQLYELFITSQYFCFLVAQQLYNLIVPICSRRHYGETILICCSANL